MPPPTTFVVVNNPPATVTETSYLIGDQNAPATVSGIDSGASLFVSISPTTATDLTASSSGASGTEMILLAVANPPPVRPAASAEPSKPQVTRAVAPYLNQMLAPSVPRAGVPGISFGYSLSGNSALW